MPIADIPVELTVEQLTAAAKRLSPAELDDFAVQLEAWRQQHRDQADAEGAFLGIIEENSRLPAPQRRRYEQLRRKTDQGRLTEGELAEYQLLLEQLEARNVKRVKALVALAERRGTTLRGVMAQLGPQSRHDGA